MANIRASWGITGAIAILSMLIVLRGLDVPENASIR